MWFMTHWLKVEPKQSTLFFKIHISFSIEEDVEQATKFLSLGDVSIEAWQEWEAKSFFKESFSFKMQSNSLEIKQFYFSRNHSLLKQNLVLKIKPHFFFKASLQSFLFFKILFSFKAKSSWDFNESLSFEISSLSCKAKLSLENKSLFFYIKMKSVSSTCVEL